ncbi:MAG: RagB/SusD family nutrient uptake outer membrane protein, partial [Coprobacter sp.]|nr:RagB/SusD family nutrient uptake outer membrane protein [Coprobacter sp.]
MKNKTVYTIATLGLCGGLLSCSDFLDTLPDNRTEINTADKVTNILVSAYPSISPIMIQELSSDNAKDNGNLYDVYGQLQQDAYLWRDVTVDDTDAPKNIWDSHYSAIASANMALQAIKEMGDPVSLSPQKGEALICRAYAHFQLANLFCMAYNPQTADTELGIPYITEPEHTVESDAERGTLKEVFEKCRQDIEEGLPLINDEIYSVPNYHFNK